MAREVTSGRTPSKSLHFRAVAGDPSEAEAVELPPADERGELVPVEGDFEGRSVRCSVHNGDARLDRRCFGKHAKGKGLVATQADSRHEGELKREEQCVKCKYAGARRRLFAAVGWSSARFHGR
jgi:hypothetical protein